MNRIFVLGMIFAMVSVAAAWSISESVEKRLASAIFLASCARATR